MTRVPSVTGGHGTPAVDGSPFAAKLIQAARMLAESASWPVLSVAGDRRVRQVEQVLELGRVRRHGRHRAGRCVALGRGVVVELVGERRHPREVQRSTWSAVHAKLASPTSALKAADGVGNVSSGYSAAIAAARASDTPRAEAITCW